MNHERIKWVPILDATLRDLGITRIGGQYLNGLWYINMQGHNEAEAVTAGHALLSDALEAAVTMLTGRRTSS